MDYPQNLSELDRRWFELIQECRTSGKSDRQWLVENNIALLNFYYHVKQLLKKSCEIPESSSVKAAEIVSASKEGVVQFPPAIDILDRTNIS